MPIAGVDLTALSHSWSSFPLQKVASKEAKSGRGMWPSERHLQHHEEHFCQSVQACSVLVWKACSLLPLLQKMAIEKAKSGGGMRPSERRAQQLQQQGSGGYAEGGGPGQYGQQGGQQGGGPRGYGGPESRGFDYGNARGRSGGNYEQPSGQYG